MAQRSRQHSAERRRLRAVRHAMPLHERHDAERRIVAALRRLGYARRGRRIAVYLARDGEVDLAGLIRAARRSGAQLYAPRITSRRRRTIRFLPLQADDPLHHNWYGIAEPAAGETAISLHRLDAVLTPLVGFDRAGYRLGMGAGYYDRALHRRLVAGRAWHRPRIVGIAFACQESDALVAARWDVPMDLVVTERGVLRPVRGRTDEATT